MERVTWKLTLPQVKQIANGNFLYISDNSNRGSGTIQKGLIGREMKGRFKREGTYVYLWLIHVDTWQETKLCKAIILQIKNFFNSLIKKCKCNSMAKGQSSNTLCWINQTSKCKSCVCLSLTNYTKVNTKCVVGLNVKHETIKLHNRRKPL